MRISIRILIVGVFFVLLGVNVSQRSMSQAAHMRSPVDSGTSMLLGDVRWHSRGSAITHEENGIIHLTIDDPQPDSALEVLPSSDRGFWDLSQWRDMAVDVKNLSQSRQQRLVLTAISRDEDGQVRKTTSGLALNPGEKRTLRLPLPQLQSYGGSSGLPGVRTINTARVVEVDFELQWPFETPSKGLVDCELSRLRVEGNMGVQRVIDKVPYVPFIDQFGQFAHEEWPRKVHSVEDLRDSLVREKRELNHASRPASWDRYGGWKNGPLLKASGSFRTEKYRGKWYFVDPDGRLFISQGLDVISGANEAFKVMPGKEDWFESLPAGAKTYNAVELNLRDKYGWYDYEKRYFEHVSRRLNAWGINSIGDWSAPGLMNLGRTPYTLQLTDYDDRMPKIQGSKLKFYDVFDPAYIAKMKTLIETAAVRNPIVSKSLSDPMCIGYFIDNELNFGNRGKMILVDEILRSPAKQASKREFIADLKRKYVDIDKLNDGWKTQYLNWDALLASSDVPVTKGYEADASLFFRKILDQYFRLAHDAVKSVAPNRLYLGARFISTDAVRPELYEACRKYCDVLSVNIYAHSASGFPSSGFPDMPVLVTEFQFGILQRGMFSPSLCRAGTTPDDRGLAYTRFLQGVLVHPNIVGAQWFQYRDQPLTGRGDGEAYQIGFVDVTDTPYPEMTKAARAIADTMYLYRLKGTLGTK